MKLTKLLLATILFLSSFSVFAEMVNLNKADATAFQHYLKGIGEKKAKNIITYRKDNKSFKTIDEIMEVKGIGKGIFKKIKMDLSLTKGVISAPAKALTKKTKSVTKTASKQNKTKNKVDTSKAVSPTKKSTTKEVKVKKPSEAS